MTNQESTSKMPLTYDDALVGVFLRTLAWELNVAKGTPSVEDIVKKYVQTAREDLGLKKTTKGAPHAFIQPLRKLNPPLLDKTQPHEGGWKNEWRLLFLPSHRIVRTLSANPVYQTIVSDYPTKKKPQGVVRFSVSLRSPALPKLLVMVGNSRPESNELKGLYFLREAESLYVGQTDEFQVRWDNHVNSAGKDVIWWVFIAPEEKNDDFSSDALNAAESLLISFWTEICRTSNQKRGKDRKPSVFPLQQAILFVEAASAAFLWLLRDKNAELKFDKFELPFKGCKANHWPECYLNPFNNSSETD
jgi:hypothetical protein